MWCGADLLRNLNNKYNPRIFKFKSINRSCDHWPAGGWGGGPESAQHEWMKLRLTRIAAKLGYTATPEHAPTHADVFVHEALLCLEIQLNLFGPGPPRQWYECRDKKRTAALLPTLGRTCPEQRIEVDAAMSPPLVVSGRVGMATVLLALRELAWPAAVLGTRPYSSWRATAIFAFNNCFFFSIL